MDEKLSTVIESRERDLGGFHVRRVLPATFRKMVGPFIFFDHMGPATFPVGSGIDVRPHPHIGLATVTFLFEGANFVSSSKARIEQAKADWIAERFPLVPGDDVERIPLPSS